MNDRSKQGMATRAVHAGVRIQQDDFIPTSPPIHHSAAYYYERMEDLDKVFAETRPGYCYTRYGNPTVGAFETAMAELEGGESSLAFASGMAAIHAALQATGVHSDAPLVAARDLYGATHVLLNQLLRSQNVDTHFLDFTDLETVDSSCARFKPAAVLAETISNPLIKLADLQALAEIAHRHGAVFIVDNTFASPCLVQPLTLGADIVIHSATKYLGGHGDALGGVAIVSGQLREKLYEVIKVTGANLGPQDAWLLLRGLRTLPLRMHRQCENALAVARWLEEHPRVATVHYPGLAAHPQHDLARRLFSEQLCGGMLSFELKNADQAEVFRLFDALEVCRPATTLGDITTLVLYPAHSSHRGLTPDERARVGISDGLVRMSLGIEDAEDIIEDLRSALSLNHS